MYLPRSLTLTATDDIKNMARRKETNKETNRQKADISKGEDIQISVTTRDTDIHWLDTDIWLTRSEQQIVGVI